MSRGSVGTLSVPAHTSAVVTSGGIAIGVPPQGALRIRRYSFSVQDLNDTGFLNLLQPIVTSYESPSGTAFCTFSSEVFPASRAGTGVVTNGAQIQKPGVSNVIVDDFLEGDEYLEAIGHILSGIDSSPNALTIHSYTEVANTDAAAHVVAFGDTLSFELWQKYLD